MWNGIQGYDLLLNTLATEKQKERKKGEVRKGERKRRRKKEEQREIGGAVWQN